MARVACLERMHHGGQLGIAIRDQQVRVVVHEAPRDELDAVVAQACAKHVQERAPVGVIRKDDLSPVATHHDVIEAALGSLSRLPCHTRSFLSAASEPRCRGPKFVVGEFCSSTAGAPPGVEMPGFRRRFARCGERKGDCARRKSGLWGSCDGCQNVDRCLLAQRAPPSVDRRWRGASSLCLSQMNLSLLTR